MSNASLVNNAINRLISQSDAVGRLAQDSGGFAAVVAAFESRDANAFRWVLERQEMLPYCEFICEWVRVKLCALRCAEICRPIEKAEVPSLLAFARAIAKLSANEKALRRVVDAVACGDAAQYQAAINEAGLGEFCQPICYWICAVSSEEICQISCHPHPLPVSDPLIALRVAGESVGKILKNEKALDAIGKAAAVADFDKVQSSVATLGSGEDCSIFCRIFCIWWRVWVCRTLCELPPPIYTGPYAIEEAQSFALAAGRLAKNPRALGDLVNAALSRDAEAYRAIVGRFGLGPYCWQLCGWICSGICFEFCIRICPPPVEYEPVFTQVGGFDIYTQINPGSGLTNTSLAPTLNMPWGGGPNFAFYNELQLGGTCPVYSPISPSTLMQFRFLYAASTTTLPAAINASQTTITVPAGATTPATPNFEVAVCNCADNGATGETMIVTSVSGTTWTVTRGTGGTSAAAAPAGATLLIGLTPITGPLVNTPLQVGQRIISWPANLLGLAGPPVSTFEPVYVGYGTDPTAPTLGSAYISPAHYLEPDPSMGWVQFDSALLTPDIQVFLNFNSAGVVVGGCSLTTPPCIGTPGGAPAGTAASNPGAGSDLAIIFQATRQGVSAIDYSNSLCKIHINNWSEVNNLWFTQYAAGCCTPIDSTLSVEFTVDHEQMAAGSWSLGISSCLIDENLTPTTSTVGPPAVTVSGRGGYGQINVDTSLWPNCSYTVELATRPGLTTGVYDNQGIPNPLTFAICDHPTTTLAAAITATQTSISVTSSAADFPTTSFNALVVSTGEIITVSSISGTSWTVTRGQAGTTAAAVAAGATVSTS
jgi:hypothetical protein